MQSSTSRKEGESVTTERSAKVVSIETGRKVPGYKPTPHPPTPAAAALPRASRQWYVDGRARPIGLARAA